MKIPTILSSLWSRFTSIIQNRIIVILIVLVLLSINTPISDFVFYHLDSLKNTPIWKLKKLVELSHVQFLAIIGTFLTLMLLYFRVIAHEKQNNIQIELKIDDRFANAIASLGSNETSARTGAIDSLYQLAIDNKKYRNQIARILCSHIRSKTQEPAYQTHHKDRPSNEIQTTIDLLFKDNGLYKEFKQLPPIDLSKSYLVRADFVSKSPKSEKTWLKNADFSYAQCQGADFEDAHCPDADFSHAQCQGVNFKNAHCQEASFFNATCRSTHFENAQCQKSNFQHSDCGGAHFKNTLCQNADFRSAQCQGADFSEARCQDANFWGAECARTKFNKAYCQKAEFGNLKGGESDFSNTHCQGANFSYANCQGADFSHAQCQGVNFGNIQCQGGNFSHAQFQSAYFSQSNFCGAYALKRTKYIPLEERLGKNTDLQTMVFAGELSDEAIEAIKAARPYIEDQWYQNMQKIIKENKGKESSYQPISSGITRGIWNADQKY